MTKKTTILIATAGAALMAASQAQAAFSNGDLLINLREPSNPSVADYEADLGPAANYNVSTPLTILSSSTTSAWTGGTISGFTDASLESAPAFGGLPSGTTVIGMSAAGGTTSGSRSSLTYNLWLTTPLSAPPTSTPTTPSIVASVATAGNVYTAINNIGGQVSSGSVAIVPSANANSYQSQAADTAAGIYQGQIDYTQAPYQGKGLESTQNGNGAIYEALWETTSVGSTETQTYEGWFTFYPDDEITFNGGIASAVPEPSTYGLLGGLGLLALALRRQFRSQLA